MATIGRSRYARRVAVLSIVVLPAACTPALAQPTLTMTLDQVSGPTGTVVTVSGTTCVKGPTSPRFQGDTSNYQDEDPTFVPEPPPPAETAPAAVTPQWDGYSITDAYAGVDNGKINPETYEYSTTFTVPGDAAIGDHYVTVYAYCETTGDTTTPAQTFTVSAPIPTLALDQTSGPAGTSVTATGSTCQVEPDQVALYWDGTLTADATVDTAARTYTATFPVPDDAAAGEHTVEAECVATDTRATAAFTVTPSEESNTGSGSRPGGGPGPGQTTEPGNVENENSPPAERDPEQVTAAPETTDASAPWLPAAGNLLTIVLAILVLVLLGLLLLRRGGRDQRAGPRSRVSVRVGAASTPTVELTESRTDRRGPGLRIAVEPRRDSGTFVLEEEIDR